MTDTLDGKRDFFISYAQRDRAWAEWITWTLEEHGYSVFLPSRDFDAGANFITEMHRAISQSNCMIIILSLAYTESKFVESEWMGAVLADPAGTHETLLPVRVEPAELPALLRPFVYIDLVGKTEDKARDQLLRAVSRQRAKPKTAPLFPCPARLHKAVRYEPLSYPGASTIDNPPELLPYIAQFRTDHPDARRNAFVMMQFRESRLHLSIAQAIRDSLAAHHIEALRADDKAYTDYLMANVRTYMHGCGFGVAVFERIESETHNPNVALEVGYMLALGKRVCLLKDSTLKQLPTDMVGSLYCAFDRDDVDESIRKALGRWLQQRGLTKE